MRENQLLGVNKHKVPRPQGPLAFLPLWGPWLSALG